MRLWGLLPIGQLSCRPHRSRRRYGPKSRIAPALRERQARWLKMRPFRRRNYFFGGTIPPSSRNFTPAASNACLMSINVDAFEGFPPSKRMTVVAPT